MKTFLSNKKNTYYFYVQYHNEKKTFLSSGIRVCEGNKKRYNFESVYCEWREEKWIRLAVESFFAQSYGTCIQRDFLRGISFFDIAHGTKIVSTWPYNRYSWWLASALMLFDVLFLIQLKKTKLKFQQNSVLSFNVALPKFQA